MACKGPQLPDKGALFETVVLRIYFAYLRVAQADVRINW